VVECLPSKYKALNSNPTTTKKIQQPEFLVLITQTTLCLPQNPRLLEGKQVFSIKHIVCTEFRYS
jgi:hypothetical protein